MQPFDSVLRIQLRGVIRQILVALIKPCSAYPEKNYWHLWQLGADGTLQTFYQLQSL
jgi:hypothetical protein